MLIINYFSSHLQALCSPLWGMGTTEATLRMENMEVKDEWQDEDFPRWDPFTFYWSSSIHLSCCCNVKYGWLVGALLIIWDTGANKLSQKRLVLHLIYLQALLFMLVCSFVIMILVYFIEIIHLYDSFALFLFCCFSISGAGGVLL